MSWCGGGEMSVTPGVACRVRAIISSTLWPGKLTALAGLGALRDLDLQLARVDEILGGHAKARRRDLLDRAVASRAEARRIFAALAGVAPPADLIHRRRPASRAPRADRPERHRARDETLHDRRGRLRRRRSARRRASTKSSIARSDDVAACSSLTSALNSRKVFASRCRASRAAASRSYADSSCAARPARDSDTHRRRRAEVVADCGRECGRDGDEALLRRRSPRSRCRRCAMPCR